MSERAAQLSRTAGQQIADLIEILSTCTDATLRLPFPGREKLGDGTFAACAQHITDNYRRIAAIPRQAAVADGTRHGHDTRYSAERVSLTAILAQLAEARDALAGLAEIADDQLDSVPAAGALRFADGRRSLEQILAAALKHQGRQVDALRAAVVPSQRSA
jgi:hypothetical protein